MASEADIRDLDRDAVAARVGGGDPELRRQRWLTFWFYVGVPLALGFLLGWLQVGRSADWPRTVALLYWIGVGLIMTPLNALGTALVSVLLRRIHSPLWLTLFFGQLVAGFLFSSPVLQTYRIWLQANVYPELLLTPATTLPQFLQRLPSNSLMWIGICLLFFYGLRMPLFGYRPTSRVLPPAEPPTAPPSMPPTVPIAVASPDGAEVAGATAVPHAPDSTRHARLALLERVRPERRGALLAVKAEGHYLQVYTDAGSDLVLYRLSDALLELGAEDGAQVHRSWWVASRALAPQRHRDRLVLANGVEVPVSRSFRVAARQRGWLTPGDPRE
jgi:hypothetical protein